MTEYDTKDEYDAADEHDEEYMPTGDAYTRYLHMETCKDTNAIKERIAKLEKMVESNYWTLHKYTEMVETRLEKLEGKE